MKDRQFREHVKRGTRYEIFNEAELQISTRQPVDGDTLVIYLGANGKLYARLREEFHDGRFKPVGLHLNVDNPHMR